MTEHELQELSRTELIALLPEGHGFNPVSSKKAEIIAAVLKAAGPPEVADLHAALAGLRIVLMDGCGQRFVINPENETEVVIRGFPETTRSDEWMYFERPLVIGEREYAVRNPA